MAASWIIVGGMIYCMGLWQQNNHTIALGALLAALASVMGAML